MSPKALQFPDKPRIFPLKNPARTLTESELKAAFGSVNEDNPLWLAINQIIAEHRNRAILHVGLVDSALNHGVLSHYAGGAEHLGALHAELQFIFDEAHVL